MASHETTMTPEEHALTVQDLVMQEQARANGTAKKVNLPVIQKPDSFQNLLTMSTQQAATKQELATSRNHVVQTPGSGSTSK